MLGFRHCLYSHAELLPCLTVGPAGIPEAPVTRTCPSVMASGGNVQSPAYRMQDHSVGYETSGIRALQSLSQVKQNPPINHNSEIPSCRHSVG